METLNIIIGGIVAIAVVGGAIFTFKKSKKVNIKKVTITGSGKVVAGDDNSTYSSDNTTNPT